MENANCLLFCLMCFTFLPFLLVICEKSKSVLIFTVKPNGHFETLNPVVIHCHTQISTFDSLLLPKLIHFSGHLTEDILLSVWGMIQPLGPLPDWCSTLDSS